MTKTFLKIITDPDWLQAIAAIATLPITLIAIIKLFQKDKEREQQINSLVKLAESQAELAESQADQLIEIRKQNEIFQSQLEISKDLHLMEKNRADKENDIRMKEIRPYFNSTGYNQKVSPNSVELSLINIGQSANKINISFPKCISIEFDDSNKEMDKIVNNHKFVLKGKTQERNFKYIIRIEFSDDDGNRYYQILNGERIFIKAKEPVLISEKDNIPNDRYIIPINP